MRKLLTMLVFGFTAVTVSACGEAGEAAQGESGAGTVSEPGWVRAGRGVAGVWERSLRNDVGPDPAIVMELKADGIYSISGVPFVEDKGSYAVENGVLSFSSNVNPGKSRTLTLRMDGENALTLHTDTPFPYSETWTRKQSGPNFPSVAINGADIPEALPLLLASALAAEARPWREDALPTSMHVERMQSGRYRIELQFFSPAASEGMRITVTEHGIDKFVLDGSRALSAPLPPIFMDLPRIVAAADAQGFKGALKKAHVSVYEGRGPAWMAFFDGARTGATFSALTGERIKGDVTGYVAQYEADWAYAGELWRKALETLNGDKDELEEYCRSAVGESTCPSVYCSWGEATRECRPSLRGEELHSRYSDFWRNYSQPLPDAWGEIEPDFGNNP